MNYNEINENHPMAWESLMGWLREKQPDRTFVLEETGALKYLWNLNVEYFNIRDLTAREMDWAIKQLEGQNVSRIARMRAKARAIASEIGVIRAGDYSRLDKWIHDKWKVDNLFMLPIDKLSECITALERWRDGRIKAAVKQQLNTF